MKLIIFSGFLGAGKTASVMSLAEYLVGHKEQRGDTRAVIVENEVGDVSYDAGLLRRDGFEIIDMLSGCICCTMGADLLVQLREIVPWYNPDYVIVEPTGLAYPEKIEEIADAANVDADWVKTVTVVDAVRYNELMGVVPSLINAQIAAADLVFVSKIDLLEDGDAIESILKDIMKKTREGVPVHPADLTDGVEESIWETIVGDDE